MSAITEENMIYFLGKLEEKGLYYTFYFKIIFKSYGYINLYI